MKSNTRPSKAAKKAARPAVTKGRATTPAAKKSAAKKSAGKKAATKKATRPPTYPEPTAEPIHTAESPNARGTHTTAGRHEIREITRRVMGSRQSQRPAERHDQPRKKR